MNSDPKQTSAASVSHNLPLVASTHSNTLIALGVFLAALALYLRTTAPTLGGSFDSEEFQHLAYILGIAHATGYPLYLLLGKLFITLVPLGNVAYRMNLLSALVGAGAAVLVYLITVKLTQRRVASIGTAAIFATNSAVWRQSGVASVGPLTMLFLGAVLYVVLLWQERRVSLAFVTFVFGLSLTHHHSILLFFPVILLFVLLVDFNIVRRPRELIRALIWLLVPLLIYLYVPIRGSVSEWYSNTLDSFFSEVVGTDAGDFLRTSPAEFVQAAATLFAYFWSSFAAIGSILLLIGAVTVFPRLNRWRTALNDSKLVLFIGLGTCLFVAIGMLYGGEPDRYFALPFFFVVFWFGIGAGFIQHLAENYLQSKPLQRVGQVLIALVVALPILFTFRDNYRYADWSSFDRVYKQWDEIFSLPIPPAATIVGNWGQLNAMRYMQYVENRRRDIRPIGTLYDPEPQTNAAREAFEQNRAIFLAPSIAVPIGSYRYALLGALLQVRDAPLMQRAYPSRAEVNLKLNPALTLADYELAVALEPHAPSPSLRVQPNRTVRVTVTWRAESRGKDFVTRLQAYDPEARVIAQSDYPPVRGLERASSWQSGEYVNDVFNLLIPAGAPPGAYELRLITIDAETKTAASDPVKLGALNIERTTALTRDQIFVKHPLDIAFESRLALWGYGAPERVAAGEQLQFNLLWAVLDKIDADTQIGISLLDASGKQVAQTRRTLIAFYPTQDWQKGETLKAYYDLRVPTDLEAGDYALTITLGAQRLSLAHILVTR